MGIQEQVARTCQVAKETGYMTACMEMMDVIIARLDESITPEARLELSAMHVAVRDMFYKVKDGGK